MLMCGSLASARTGRALIVAIGEYPADSGWERIHGDNDGTMMAELLERNHYGQIIRLRNEKATKQAVGQALEQLCESTESGDYVFLHFSCHGQQMMDLNGDEEDGLDEALVPYDALFWYLPGRYEGENHLCDDELGVWIDRLRCKAGRRGRSLYCWTLVIAGRPTVMLQMYMSVVPIKFLLRRIIGHSPVNTWNAA